MRNGKRGEVRRVRGAVWRKEREREGRERRLM